MWAVALIGLASGNPAGAAASAGAAVSDGPAIGVSPLAAEPVRVLNDNGGWCWFQGGRALIAGDGRLLVGSTASSTGAAGSARSGAVEVASFDLRTSTVTQTDRLTGPGQYRSDDHNSPGLAEVGGGRVVAAWAGHNDDWRKQSGTLDPTDAAWTVNAATIRGRSTTYSNLLRLPAENGGKGRLYDFFRAEGSAVNAMTSDDDGRTWVDAGRLVSNGTLHPYTRFAVNGPDRIEFITTSGNPQSVRGSGVRSGFLKGGRIYTTDGRQVGSLGAGVEWGALTPLQLGVTAFEGADTDVWTADLVVGPNGPVAALTVKHPRPPNVTGRSFDQEYLYATWSGGAWTVRHVAWGGSELYAEQPSYSGNLVIDPANVSRVYLSSNVNPVDGSALLSAADGAAHWEVYDALTSDAGATWSISSVTKDSVSDNIRPVAVAGYGASALLWMRGTYDHFRTFNTAIVGVVNPGPLGTSSVPRAAPTRLARTASVVTGSWTGAPSAGLFVLGTASTASGFVLPAGRGQRHPFVAVTLRGTYSGFRADLTGSGRDSVILVDATPGRSVAARTTLVASLGADQAVKVEPLPSPAGATPVVGDFNGDGRDDIVWYRAGSGPDEQWTSKAGGGWTVTPVSVSGTYRPVVGDFDGNGRADLFWYAPGTARDSIWTFTGTSHASVPVGVNGSYFPVVLDHDGDRRADVYWQSRRATVRSSVWSWPSGAIGRPSSRPATTTYTPGAAGDFDGDGRDDILFDRAGDSPDSWWWTAAGLTS